MGCHTCQIACKEQNNLPAAQRWRRVIEFSEGGFAHQARTVRHAVRAWYLSISCNHCLAPLCVENCPSGALARSQDGLVLLDTHQCIGCAYCVWSCPYGAPQLDPASGKVGKCDACADRQREGLQPACVDACPVRALSFGPLADPVPGTHPRGLPPNDLTLPSLAVRPHRDARAHRLP